MTTPWLAALLLYAALLQGLVLGPHMVLRPLVSEQKLGGAAARASIGVGLQGSYFLTTQVWMLQVHVPEERLSRVAACSQLGNFVLVPLGLVVAGQIVAQLGAPILLATAAVWVVVSTLGTLGVPAVRMSESNAEEVLKG